MTESKEIRTLRAMAWQRAKGELQAMLETYWAEAQKHNRMQAELSKFIEAVENNCLNE